jgi:hypothetical protein
MGVGGRMELPAMNVYLDGKTPAVAVKERLYRKFSTHSTVKEEKEENESAERDRVHSWAMAETTNHWAAEVSEI